MRALDLAHDYKLSPVRVLGLPWPEWGETATTLLWAGAELRAMRCPCGCGHWADEATDPANEGRFLVDTIECFARKALIEHAEMSKPQPHVLTGARLVTAETDHELSFDPSKAAEIHAAHYEKFEGVSHG